MFTNDITCNDGAANHIYALVDLGATGCVAASFRREAAAPADQQATMVIKHQVTGSELKTVNSTLVRLDRVVEDANGNQGTVTCYMVLRWNPKVATAAQAQKAMTELKDFLGQAGFQGKLTSLEP